MLRPRDQPHVCVSVCLEETPYQQGREREGSRHLTSLLVLSRLLMFYAGFVLGVWWGGVGGTFGTRSSETASVQVHKMNGKRQ